MHTQTHLTTPLSNMQLELLKLFSRDIEDTDLLALKKLIVRYLAKKASRLADNIWDEKEWTDKDMDKLLNQHERTPYNHE